MKRIVSILSLLLLTYMTVQAQSISSKFQNLEVINKENVQRLERLATFGRGTIGALDWSPDDKQIAVGGSAGIWVYQSDDLTATPKWLDHIGYVNDVAYSTDGKLLFAAGSNGLTLFDTATGKKIRHFCFQGYVYEETPLNCPAISHIGISKDGKLLAITLNDHIVIWDIQARKERYRLFDDDVSYAEFAVNDTMLVTTSKGWSNTVRFWDIATLSESELNEKSTTLETNLPFGLWDMQVSPDSRQIIIAGFDVTDTGVAKIDVQLQKIIASYMGIGNASTFISENLVAGAALTFNDGFTATYGVTVVDLRTRKKTYTIDTGSSAAEDIALSKDEQRIAIGTVGGNLFVHDLQSRQTISSSSELADYKWDIAFSDDGLSLAILSGNGIMAPTLAGGGAAGGSQIDFWHLDDNTFESTPNEENHYSQMNNIVPDGNGDFVVTGYETGSISQWSLTNGFRELARFPFDYTQADYLDASTENGKIVFALRGMLKAIGTVDLNATRPEIIYYGKSDEVSFTYGTVAVHPSGDSWAAVTDSRLSIWEKGEAEAKLIHAKYASITDIDFSDDGLWLAINSFNGYGPDNITLFDTKDFSPKIILTDENFNVDQIQFNPKSDLLFTSNIHGDLMVWPVENKAHPIIFKAHNTNIQEIAINKQGTLIATCSFDGTVQVWGVPASS